MNAPVSAQIGEHIAQKQRHITKIFLIFVKERGCTIQGEMDYME